MTIGDYVAKGGKLPGEKGFNADSVSNNTTSTGSGGGSGGGKTIKQYVAEGGALPGEAGFNAEAIKKPSTTIKTASKFGTIGQYRELGGALPGEEGFNRSMVQKLAGSTKVTQIDLDEEKEEGIVRVPTASQPGFTPGGTISASKRKKKSIWDKFKNSSFVGGLFGNTYEEKTATGAEKLETVLTGRSPSGKIKTRTEANLEQIGYTAGNVFDIFLAKAGGGGKTTAAKTALKEAEELAAKRAIKEAEELAAKRLIKETAEQTAKKSLKLDELVYKPAKQSYDDFLRSIKGTTKAVAKTTEEVVPKLKEIPKVPPKAPITLPDVKKTVTFLAGQTARGYVYPNLAGEIGKKTAEGDLRQMIENPEFKQSMKVAKSKQLEGLYNQAWYKGIAGELPLTTIWLGASDFEAAAREEAQRLGYKGHDIDRYVAALKRQNKYRQSGEFFSLLSISKASEKFGRAGFEKAKSKAVEKGVQFTEKQSFGQISRMIAPTLAIAGFGEGASSELSQQQARREELNLKRIGLMGGFGAISATGLGTVIAGTAISKPGVSKTVSFIANIADPLEKPGDIAQDISEAAARRIFGKEIPNIPILTVGGKKQAIISFGGEQPKGKAKTTPFSIMPDKKVRVKNLITLPSGKSKTNTFIENIIGKTPSIIETPSEVPIDTSVKIPDPVPTITNTFTETNTQVATNTQNVVNSLINIPTSTPILRIPPPVPLNLPFGLGGAGTAKGKRKKYISELDIGLSLFSSMAKANKPQAFTDPLFTVMGKPKRTVTKKAKRKKKR